MEGSCTCGRVRFRLTDRPLFVHACHCRWCQRETGSAFAWNAMIEADRVDLLAGEPVAVMTPSASGQGQEILRCPDCHVALWSHYASMRRALAFVRVGTLARPADYPPDIHIFAETRQLWVTPAPGVPVAAEYYDRRTLWPDWALERFAALTTRIDAR
ncbi:MAG: GFA family protein [Paracoccaceae bacterium]